MDRRHACRLLALAPFAGIGIAFAQPVRKSRVAWVTIDAENALDPSLAAFRSGMRAVGRVEGPSLVIDTWWGGLSTEGLKKLVPTIVASRPDVIVARNSASLRPLIDAGVTIPTVFTYSGDPVAGGIVDTFAKPGRNRTGVAFQSPELVSKRIALTKELLPHLKRLAIVAWPRHPGEVDEYTAARTAVAAQRLEHKYFPVSEPDDLDGTLQTMVAWRPDAILAFADSITLGHADRIAAFATRTRIPAVSGWAIFAEKGNLMSYGPKQLAAFSQLAPYVDKILKGAKAGELPIERPRVLELVINQVAARDLGVVVPPAMLARADRVLK